MLRIFIALSRRIWAHIGPAFRQAFSTLSASFVRSSVWADPFGLPQAQHFWTDQGTPLEFHRDPVRRMLMYRDLVERKEISIFGLLRSTSKIGTEDTLQGRAWTGVRTSNESRDTLGFGQR